MDERQRKIDIFSLQTQSTSNQSVINESMNIEMKQVELDNFEIENESNEVTVVYESIILNRKKLDAVTTEYPGFRPKIEKVETLSEEKHIKTNSRFWRPWIQEDEVVPESENLSDCCDFDMKLNQKATVLLKRLNSETKITNDIVLENESFSDCFDDDIKLNQKPIVLLKKIDYQLLRNDIIHPTVNLNCAIKPKFEIKSEPIEPKKELDDELKIGFGVLESMDNLVEFKEEETTECPKGCLIYDGILTSVPLPKKKVPNHSPE